VSHALADAFTEVDSARLLVWRTVDAIARKEKDAAAMLSMAYWWSTSNAGAAALKSMRIFGGYGMTMEYDAQLYFRRANAHSIVAGDPDSELERAAARLFDGEKAVLPDAGDIGIDFDWGAKAAAARETMREFCKKRDTPELRRFFRIRSTASTSSCRRSSPRKACSTPSCRNRSAARQCRAPKRPRSAKRSRSSTGTSSFRASPTSSGK